MRRTLWLLAGVLLGVAALGSDSPKEYDDRTTVDPLEGTWRLIEWECNGNKSKPGRKFTNTYHSGTFTWDSGDGDPWRGTHRIDPFS